MQGVKKIGHIYDPTNALYQGKVSCLDMQLVNYYNSYNTLDDDGGDDDDTKSKCKVFLNIVNAFKYSSSSAAADSSSSAAAAYRYDNEDHSQYSKCLFII